jgi:hypothetical protein
MPWDAQGQGRSSSAIFREWLSASLEPRTGFAGAWNADNVFRVALYNNNITPDERVDAVDTAYGSGEWDVAEEQTDTPGASRPGEDNWPAGGLPVEETGSAGDPTASPPTGFESADIMITFRGLPTGTGTNLVTLNNVFGDLLYDTTSPADDTDPGTPQDVGAAFHYFAGIQNVTDGTFTIVWNPDGIMRVGVAIPP